MFRSRPPRHADPQLPPARPRVPGRWSLTLALALLITLGATGTALAAAPVVGSVTPSASRGDRISVSGSNFTGTTAVAVNGTSVPFLVNTATSITAQIPDAATSAINGQVAVTNPDGTGSSSGSFTLVLTPTVSDVKITRRANGLQLVLTGKNLNGTTGVTVGGASTPFTLANDRRIYVPVLADPGSITVGVTTAEGSTSRPYTADDMVLVNGFAPGAGAQFDVEPAALQPVQATRGSYTGLSGISYKHESFLSSFPYYLDRGAGPTVVDLVSGASTIDTPLALAAANQAGLAGHFTGSSGNQIDWTGTYSLAPGSQAYVTTFRFTAATGTLGALTLRPRLDEDVFALGNDFAATLGSTGDDSFTVFAIDGPERFGYGVSGVFTPASGTLENASFDGYAIGNYSSLSSRIIGRTQSFATTASAGATTPPSNINTTEMPASADADLGTIYGGNGSTDAGTALSWTADPSATTGAITVILRNQASSPGAMTLGVTKAGTGQGSVIADSGALNCGSTCSDDYPFGTTVTLTTTPATGSTFSGWGGACSGTATSCPVGMTQAQAVTATFTADSVPAEPTPAEPTPAEPEPVAELRSPITRSGGKARPRVTASLRLPLVGRYTFMYLDRRGKRVGILRGSTLGSRPLHRRFSAPVLRTTTPAARVKLVVRLVHSAPKRLTLRVVREDADGSLHEALLK
jgi:hypothetical protein